tara:strand:- start:390 stop:1229 length:840 start_codon:yes stop_codon:yes gene_type:complete
MNTTQAININCKGTLVDLSKPKIMGILNLTPDSFFDGGKYNNEDAALKQCEKMISEGADFVDIGTSSSKPGAKEISEDEELNRLLPTLERILKEFPGIFFSIDTFRSNVAEKALDRGAALINDISAGNLDPKMLETVGKHKVPFIAMHMQGTPSSMQLNPTYKNIIGELIYFFSEKIKEAHSAGINDIIIDPGFGFGKTIPHNYEILKKLETFQSLNTPILIGVSRKSMIFKKLGIDASLALNGTSVLNTVALSKKAQILRVHDVKEAKECVYLLEALQ